MANATAASTPLPIDIANAVARTPPIFTSGGIYAPTEIAPINNNSRLAPISTPVFTSPKARPTSGPNTIGLNVYRVPNA